MMSCKKYACTENLDMRLQKRIEEQKLIPVLILCKTQPEVTLIDKLMYLFCVFITLLTILTK